MINPITGKNFEPSWKFAIYLTDALDFYSRIEAKIGRKLWHPMPILRLAGSEKEFRKILSKLGHGEIAAWVKGEVMTPVGWVGAVELQGEGRLDTAGLLEGSGEYFAGWAMQRPRFTE